MSAPPPSAEAAFSRVLNHGTRLAEALDELAAVGGLRKLARTMRPASVDRVAGLFGDLVAEAQDQLDGLARPVKPARRTLLRRQTNARLH